MELDSMAWVVRRHVIDPRLDELDLPAVTTGFGDHAPLPFDLPADLLGLDTQALRDLTLETLTLLATGNEVTSAG